MNVIKNGIYKLVGEKIEKELTEADMDLSFEDLGLNSLEYIQMIVSIEEEFAIKFSDEILFKGKDCSANEFADLVENIILNNNTTSGNQGELL